MTHGLLSQPGMREGGAVSVVTAGVVCLCTPGGSTAGVVWEGKAREGKRREMKRKCGSGRVNSVRIIS